MIMTHAKSGDSFGVNFNFNFVLLQTRENEDQYDEVRIKLAPSDVDDLIEALTYYKDRVVKWQQAVGPKKDGEEESAYLTRMLQTARDNNYWSGRQEE